MTTTTDVRTRKKDFIKGKIKMFEPKNPTRETPVDLCLCHFTISRQSDSLESTTLTHRAQRRFLGGFMDNVAFCMINRIKL